MYIYVCMCQRNKIQIYKHLRICIYIYIYMYMIIFQRTPYRDPSLPQGPHKSPRQNTSHMAELSQNKLQVEAVVLEALAPKP